MSGKYMTIKQKRKYMNKKRIYKFKLEDGNFEEIESLGYKIAVKSFQLKYPNLKVVLVHHINKKGEWLITKQELPMGRKKKLR